LLVQADCFSFPFTAKVKHIEAFDISSKMIEKAKQEKEKRHVKNIHFSCTNLFDENFKPGSFDVIFAFNILLYFKDMNTIVQRMYALLKPGGMIIFINGMFERKKEALLL
jgi:2-polyprenyl-3-methyl-5-hydroxy-6-metoxy-1,4-benzoquinol methylase